MQKEEEIKKPGYSLVYHNDRSANSGGTLIGARENIKNISLGLTQENNADQSLWILVINTNKKIWVGIINAPPENVTPNNQLKIIYEDVREQIKIEKEEKQQTIILDDFNTTIGAAIEVKKVKVTKGSRQLLKLANRKNMIIIKEKYKGVWKGYSTYQ